jgi:membrane protein required for colicin V production
MFNLAKKTTMNFIDIIFGALLAFALYNGIKKGLFVELASLVSLFIGIFVALKFSYFIKYFLQDNVSWNPRTIEVTAFALTFIIVVVAIHLLAKVFTKIADFAYLGWINKLAGAAFSMIKTILALSILIAIFNKINVNNLLVKQETLDQSVLFNPVQEVSKFIYPRLETWYNDFKEKTKDLNLKSEENKSEA